MQRLLTNELKRDSGYFHVWISATKGHRLFSNTRDQAFFLSLVQDNFSPRKQISATLGLLRSSMTPDLLAYSLTPTGVHLLIFTTSKSTIEVTGQRLLLDYVEYLQKLTTMRELPFETLFTFDALTGRHEALAVSRDIHLLHPNWQEDRYSSIGFFIHDRRGDWMRPARLVSLFHNKPEWYLKFLKSRATESDRIFQLAEKVN